MRVNDIRPVLLQRRPSTLLLPFPLQTDGHGERLQLLLQHVQLSALLLSQGVKEEGRGSTVWGLSDDLLTNYFWSAGLKKKSRRNVVSVTDVGGGARNKSVSVSKHVSIKCDESWDEFIPQRRCFCQTLPDWTGPGAQTSVWFLQTFLYSLLQSQSQLFVWSVAGGSDNVNDGSDEQHSNRQPRYSTFLISQWRNQYIC